MIFKWLLLLLLGGFVVYILLLPKERLRWKAFILGMVAVMMIFVANPEWSTQIANYFGIVRGVDFLFYLSHLALFSIAFVFYLKFKNLEIKLAKVVRQIALDKASPVE